MNFWIKNTDGKPSASLTLIMITFTVIIAWMVISIFVNPFGIQTVPFNASDAMIVLTPLLGLYFGRRHTEKNSLGLLSKDKKTKSTVVESENDPEDVQ